MLSGTAKDAFVDRAVAAIPGLGVRARARVASCLKRELASVVPATAAAKRSAAGEASAARAQRGAREKSPAGEALSASPAANAPEPAAPAVAFDPFTPNVVVVIRTQGREAALAALVSIDDVANLKLLAREQQLGIPPDLHDAGEIRCAIVAAADRRIANRRAAAS